jgi:TPR repeat protein
MPILGLTMNSKPLSRIALSLLLGATLVAFTGCKKEADGSSGATISAAEMSQLEAKAAQGDGDAAMKLGEAYANKGKNREDQIAAAKWFHIAGRLGNANASMGLTTVQSQMTFDDQSEAERQAMLFKVPEKPAP